MNLLVSLFQPMKSFVFTKSMTKKLIFLNIRKIYNILHKINCLCITERFLQLIKNFYLSSKSHVKNGYTS